MYPIKLEITVVLNLYSVEVIQSDALVLTPRLTLGPLANKENVSILTLT